MKHVDIYTDGACSGNPGPGGWGAVLVYKGQERELSGGEAHTTNNRMELTAAIRALEALREPCEVTLTTDSRYLCDGLDKKWAEGWRRRGWKKVSLCWIRGHAGHEYNERCDALAVAAASKFR